VPEPTESLLSRIQKSGAIIIACIAIIGVGVALADMRYARRDDLSEVKQGLLVIQCVLGIEPACRAANYPAPPKLSTRPLDVDGERYAGTPEAPRGTP